MTPVIEVFNISVPDAAEDAPVPILDVASPALDAAVFILEIASTNLLNAPSNDIVPPCIDENAVVITLAVFSDDCCINFNFSSILSNFANKESGITNALPIAVFSPAMICYFLCIIGKPRSLILSKEFKEIVFCFFTHERPPFFFVSRYSMCVKSRDIKRICATLKCHLYCSGEHQVFSRRKSTIAPYAVRDGIIFVPPSLSFFLRLSGVTSLSHWYSRRKNPRQSSLIPPLV